MFLKSWSALAIIAALLLPLTITAVDAVAKDKTSSTTNNPKCPNGFERCRRYLITHAGETDSRAARICARNCLKH